MENKIKLVLQDGTEIGINNNDTLYIHGRYVNYNMEHIFCYGDDIIIKELKSFANGEKKEVYSISTTEPWLTFVFYPKGAMPMREVGIGEFQFDDMKQYEDNFIKIEIDLCNDGVFGGSFWSVYLTAEETSDLINQCLKCFG